MATGPTETTSKLESERLIFVPTTISPEICSSLCMTAKSWSSSGALSPKKTTIPSSKNKLACSPIHNISEE